MAAILPLANYHFASAPICSRIGRHEIRSTKGKSLNLVGTSRRGIVPVQVQCVANSTSSTHKVVSDVENNNINARRSGNYHSPVWHFHYIQSIKSKYTGEPYLTRISKLKEHVKVMLEKEADPVVQLEYIDMLQRLGISYHFENEIKGILKGIHCECSCNQTSKNNNLHAAALQFRLLRQHRFCVAHEVFNAFKDDRGNFKECMGDDVMGMLSLYEASFYLIEGESDLDEAIEFSGQHLLQYIKQKRTSQDDYLYVLVRHALELPLHWRMLRLEARWFIDVYEKRPDMNPAILELAKLDFNMTQSTHQEDLKHVSLWWKESGLGDELKFARDRLMENFFWTVGMIFEPQYGYCRRMLTKLGALITIIDDIFDVYGTLDELELFTDVVKRWDMNAKDQLPDYMKTCFLVLHSFTNSMAFDVLQEQGFHVLKSLGKTWADLCDSYLVEAKWYYNGYKPTLQEYIENAWVSISAPLILAHAYFLVTNPITEEALEFLEEYPDIIRQSSIILRLANDLGTSSPEMKRGDVPKSLQCYMHEKGVSEDEARKHIELLISESWKQMNKDRMTNSPLSQAFIEIVANLARTGHCIYQHGDGYGVQAHRETKDRVLSVLINPIPIRQEEYLPEYDNLLNLCSKPLHSTP